MLLEFTHELFGMALLMAHHRCPVVFFVRWRWMCAQSKPQWGSIGDGIRGIERPNHAIEAWLDPIELWA